MKIDTASYMLQLAAAVIDEQKFFDALREGGWQYNSTLQIWTHPNEPGVEIMR